MKIEDVQVGDVLIYHSKFDGKTYKYKVFEKFRSELWAIVISPMVDNSKRIFGPDELKVMEKENG